MLILFVLFFCLMRFTSFGRNCYAIGGNYEVAKYSGIKVIPIKWTAYYQWCDCDAGWRSPVLQNEHW